MNFSTHTLPLLYRKYNLTFPYPQTVAHSKCTPKLKSRHPEQSFTHPFNRQMTCPTDIVPLTAPAKWHLGQ